MKTWYISSKNKRITAKVSTTDDIITQAKTAPILKKFIGQPFSNLKRWMKDGVVILINDGDN